MLKNAVILSVFNSRLDDNCDYVANTFKILSRDNQVIGLALGETKSWKDLIKFFAKRKNLKEYFLIRKWNSKIYIPFQFIPGQRWEFIKRINYLISFLLILIFFYRKYKNRKKYFWFFELNNIDLFLFLTKNFFISVFDCVDYHAGNSLKLESKLSKLIKKSNHVFANSESLRKQLIKISAKKNITSVPLGFALRQFSKNKIIFKDKKLNNIKFRIVFIGTINNRVDYELVTLMAKELHNCDFIFVGPKANINNDKLNKKIKRLFSYSNVKYYGVVSKNKIPGLLKRFDFGFIPYRIDDKFNKFCYPMKLAEYFYCGLPVISTNIKEVAKFKQDCLIINRKNFKYKINNFSDDSIFCRTSQHLRRKIALDQTWDKKIEEISKYIK